MPQASGAPWYLGYSGAPGSRGRCAGSCHGPSDGTIVVRGFPGEYQPGETYIIWVSHDGGQLISNFNGSVRIGAGSETAGVIEAGWETVTYSIVGEENGVRLMTNYQDSCYFRWTAPDTGVGDVTLYVAGAQSELSSGPNSEFVLVSTQGSGIEESPGGAPLSPRFSVRPTVVTRGLTMTASVVPGQAARVWILDCAGRLKAVVPLHVDEDGSATAAWSPSGRSGQRLPAGTYIAVLVAEGHHAAKPFTISGD